MTPVLAICLFIALFILELVYFKLADHFNIIDKPNERSSHSSITLRGGGIIFPVASVLFFLCFSFQYPWFLSGLVAIALISFLDDLHTLNNKIRLGVHMLAVGLLFYQWDLFNLPWYGILIAAILVIGTINAYNFMDGINGITGLYSLITILSFYYINENVVVFTSSDFLILIGLSLLVFNFFNFRKKAKCFAGDVGSVSIAFILIFLLGQLILKTENLTYILLLLVYGLDAVTTIIFRIIRKENIFEAHRSHFYQYLANERKWPHVWVSALYALVQLGVNTLLIALFTVAAGFSGSFLIAILSGIITGLVFIGLRIGIEGKERLFNPQSSFPRRREP